MEHHVTWAWVSTERDRTSDGVAREHADLACSEIIDLAIHTIPLPQSRAWLDHHWCQEQVEDMIKKIQEASKK